MNPHCRVVKVFVNETANSRNRALQTGARVRADCECGAFPAVIHLETVNGGNHPQRIELAKSRLGAAAEGPVQAAMRAVFKKHTTVTNCREVVSGPAGIYPTFNEKRLRTKMRQRFAGVELFNPCFFRLANRTEHITAAARTRVLTGELAAVQNTRRKRFATANPLAAPGSR